MRVIIPGGSGHLGTLLAKSFSGEGHDVIVISRQKLPTLPWHVAGWEDLANAVDGADVVVNLAGRSVDCRYVERNRREILESRVETTRAVGEAIARAVNAPHVWLQASTATIYAHRYDAANDEWTGLLGGDEPGAPDTWKFSIDVARAWECTFDKARTPRTRKVKMRTAIVMDASRGGAFATCLRLVRAGVGGHHGDGRQFLSWIHGTDFVRAVKWLIDRRFLDGAVNLVSPNPLPNADFMRALRVAWGRRVGVPATKMMLEAGAFLIRTETELVLKSRRVVPARLLQSGFRFAFPAWPEAARDLCTQWRNGCADRW